MKRLAIGLCVLLCGCVPWPHRANLTPGVAGTLVVQGQLQADVPLRVVASEPGAPCEGESREFRTTDEGTFYGSPVRTFNMFMMVMAHRRFAWALCAQQGPAWTPLYQDETYTLVDSGPWFLVEMDCEDGTCTAEENLEPGAALIRELEKRND